MLGKIWSDISGSTTEKSSMHHSVHLAAPYKMNLLYPPILFYVHHEIKFAVSQNILLCK